VKFFYL